MSQRVLFSNDDGVAVIQIDNPPVNALTAEVSDGLAAAIARVDRDLAARAVVIMGAGRTFIAGADINVLQRVAWEGIDPPDLHGLLNLIEDCSKPVVAALHGTALGGGLEIAMAAHYRVASVDARLGLPEVNLGIIPGAEGTQRVTRLIGPEKAIEMCVSGKPIAAPDARQWGLVDQVVEGDLKTAAIAFARAVAADGASPPKTRDRRDKLGTPESNAPILAAGREMARKTRRNMEAPLAVIDAIEAATTLPFAEGCRRERAISLQRLRSDECKALVYAFFAERAAAHVPDLPKDTGAAAVRSVGIVGAGTMGGGIAMACANAGLHVRLTDADRAALERGIATIRRNYESSVKRGRLSADAVEQRLSLIQPVEGYDGFDRVDTVIEAVFENLALKKKVFAELDRIVRPGCVLATNTSTLDVDAIAAATSRPDAVAGTHFFSPAQVMRLLEVVRGRATGIDVLATVLATAKRLGKVGVVVHNAPGFVGNRMMFPYMYEAQFLVEEGATPEQVDRVLTDWGMAMGIFAVDDMGGLDVAWRVRQELHQFEEPGARKPLVADALVEMGRLGQKAGKGWYRYGDDRKPIVDPEVLGIVERVSTAAGIRRRPIGNEEIFERTIYALINEGARVLNEGVALRASDIDVIYLTGYGFPAYRGGPMFYADRIGLGKIYDRISVFHRQFGQRWQPAPLLERLAREGSSFRQFDAGRETAGTSPRAS